MANQIKELLQMLRSGGAPKGMTALYSVDEVRRYAKKRLPKTIYDLVYGGANDETTLAANWEDLQWVRERWKGPLFVKGIITPEDALKAADLGVDGIVDNIAEGGLKNVICV